MIEGILIGLETALSLKNLLMVMMGCFFGTIIGMLPGLGPMTAIALMIPITYGFEPSTGLILMAGVYYGAVFGGSTSSMHREFQVQLQQHLMVIQWHNKVKQEKH